MSSTLLHMLTLAFLDSTDPNYTLDSDWARIRPYVDYAVVKPRDVNALHALGVRTGFYVTAHTICVPRTDGECQPSSRTMPEAAFVHSCSPPHGRVMWNPERSAENRRPFYQYLGDVRSPALARAWNRFLDSHRADEYGPLNYDFAFEDNAMVPGDNLNWQHYYVRGSQAEQSPRPYCGYSDRQFMRDELHLENQAHYPLILNALNASDRRPRASLAVSYLPASRNAIGAMLEYVYGSTVNGPEREKEGGDIWRSEENTELAMVQGRKLFVGYEHNGGNDAHALDIRGYQLASLLLTFDPRYVALAQDGPGTRSGLGLNPEIGLVATEPIHATPASIRRLRTSTGAYAREFRACTVWGKPIGPCAAIVNPDESRSVQMSRLTQTYTHHLALSGSGVVAGIDTGKILLQQGLPAEALGPKEWQILAR
jgi:hypothetical protein